MIGQKIERRENKWILYIVWTLDGKKSEMERERERERELTTKHCRKQEFVNAFCIMSYCA
jgi:hypothetical protein